MRLRAVVALVLLSAAVFAAPACSDGDSSWPPGSAGSSGTTGEGGDAGEDGSIGESGAAGKAGAGDAGSGGADAGAGGDSGEGGSGGQTSCAALTLGRPFIHFNPFGEVTGLRYPVEDVLGDAELPEYVLVELYDSTTPAGDDFLPPLEAGEFDLTQPPDDSINTCQHCVILVTDVTEGFDPFGLPIFEPGAWYFQRSGELALEEVHDPLNEWLENTAMAGNIAGVELAPVDSDDPAFPFVEGECFYVASATFDTRPTPGKACEDLDDCGNELLEICDPSTLRCVNESQCNIDQPCESDAFCINQSPRSGLGACYPACEPFTSGACDDGWTCVQYGLSEGDGYCLTAGSTPIGDACEVKDAVTSCADDGVCVGSCVAQCGYFSGDPACAEGTACDALGHCLEPSLGEEAALGETCRAGAELAAPCARSEERFDGFCFGYDPARPYVCLKSCFVDEDDYDGNADDGATDTDCDAAEFCALRFSSGLGACLPDPVCGDGAFGEVGEVCDDGNTTSDDGCSSDCQTVEYDRLCAAPPVLGADDEVESTTEGGLDGFQSTCQAGIARGRLYTVIPPGRGQLKLSLSSRTRQIVALRSSCASVESELGCGESSPEGQGDASLLLQVTSDDPEPITVVVTAATVIDEGPFTLEAEFTPEECGDSLVVGSETCDDGNETSGDGCSADCQTIEYDYWCENAETLPLDEVVAGNVAGAPFLFQPSCGYGAGADRLYRLTAPRDGTLTVRLNQVVGGLFTDLALTVLADCGAPETTTELGCSAVVYEHEEVSVEVNEGETVVMAVDGLFATEGAFEISAVLD
jgi:cysteine-rich repeat protein